MRIASLCFLGLSVLLFVTGYAYGLMAQSYNPVSEIDQTIAGYFIISSYGALFLSIFFYAASFLRKRQD
ncbi:hypothetical protein WJT86_01660 [Microvirga sp. W0021]|uniref:Uncharacterized protein n=1 Tax=Hohaiivirga grylli TaxID=3133970 RepID=A0ABV0BI17_9HYPH